MQATQAKFRNATGPWLPALFAIVLAGASTAAVAQDRDSLPIPDPAFKGKIGKTISGVRTPDYPQPGQGTGWRAHCPSNSVRRCRVWNDLRIWGAVAYAEFG